MAVPLRAKRGLKKRKQARGDQELGEGLSNGSSTLRGLGELVRPFADHLEFREAFESEQDSASARALMAPQLPELRSSLRQLTQRLGSLRTSADTIAQRLGGEESAGSGELVGSAAYMDMKVQMLLSYVVGLTYYVLLKARGAPVRDHPVALRLMWLRTLLEKLRPVDQRLQYQMNKLLETIEAGAGAATATDPRTLRPGDLSTTVEDDASGEEAEEADAHAAQEDDGIYRPPRISQVEYTGDHITTKEKAEREFERQKRRFEHSDMVRSLREEFTDAPVEIRGEQKSNAAEKAQRKMDEQIAYEEDNMVRLRATRDEKKEKQRLFRAKRGQSGGAVSLEDAANLNDLAAALGQGGKGGKAGKGKGRGRRGGTALQGFQGAAARLRDARAVVDSVSGGRMPEGMGTFKRGRGGGDSMGGGKKRRNH